jgi:HSP20 family protein
MVNRTSQTNRLDSAGDKSEDLQLDTNPFHLRFSLRSSSWQPPADVYETEDAVIVRVEIAGMREDNFSIELNGRYLIIRGSRQDITERRAYHQMEIRFGEFSVELEVPFPVETEQIEASYQQGFLRVFMPKVRPKHIEIK